MKKAALILVVLIISLNSCKSSKRKLLGPKGEFLVETIATDSVADKKITLNFNTDTGQLNGTGVCNSYSSTYVVSGENIKFSPAMSTKMMCPEGTSIEYNFFQALLKANTYTLNKGILSLYNNQDELILTAKDE